MLSARNCRYVTKCASRIQSRSFFGLGEIVGVLANPGETVRQITESKKLLAEAREEIKNTREKAQIPRLHTFAALPNFFDRPNEIKAIKAAVSGTPALTIIFGASSVGKTALLRQVLSSDRYHVLHFDLRIAGFADLTSLYFSLSMQMEEYFRSLSEKIEGYGQFEKESWAFKHDRVSIEKRIEGGGQVKTADIAKLMELLQSGLLSYWSFVPPFPEGEEGEWELDASSDSRIVEPALPYKLKVDGKFVKRYPPQKLIPVFFLDEAHKLPALIQSDSTMKCFLDALLVLTKQDRLINCVHASSDSFYLHWMRRMNILQHALLLSIGDVSKNEAGAFYNGRLLPQIPEDLQSKLDFEALYTVFGGKLSHMQDFVSDFINSNGTQSMKESSHYLQAYTLLNLHLVHSTPSSDDVDEQEDGGQGFHIYSPITQRHKNSDTSYTSSDKPAAFTADQLLQVMRRLKTATGLPWTLPYFEMCRMFGARTIDAMVAGRILELRWTPAITLEEDTGTMKRPPFTGPELHPTTPIMRYAMDQILKEWPESE